MTTTKSVPQDSPAQARQESCVEVPFELVSEATSKFKRVPMTSGLCFPKGVLADAGEWLVECGGAHLPAQTEVLNRWSDGSVRWMLTRFVAGRIMPGRTSCALLRPEKRAQHFTGSTSLRHEEGGLVLNIRRPHDASDTRIRLTPEVKGVGGEPLDLQIESVNEQTTGDVCCVFVVQAVVRGMQHITIQLRIEVWPTCGLVRTDLRLRNSRRAQHKGGLWDLGDEGSFRFRSCKLHVRNDDLNGGELKWKAEPASETRESTHGGNVKILQIGSGSAAWASENHVSADGVTTVRSRGYEVRSNAGVLRGYRSEPVVSIVTNDSQMTVAMPEFWQQFPSGIQAHSDNGPQITAAPFPAGNESYELQGGEQKTQAVWISTQRADGIDGMDWVYEPPRVNQSANWVKNANVIPWLPEATDFQDETLSRYQEFIRESTTGDLSMSARREKIDEYGWRNFGDVAADHEQVNYAGTETIVSHYNNQFDLIFGGIQNLLLTGDPRWFDLLDPLARHVVDIDIYHTQEDRACFNGGLFWHTDHYVAAKTATHRTYSRDNAGDKECYGGGPSNEHNYTTGLLYYHFLTGSREAFDAVVSLADWVIGMDDGAQSVLGLFDSGDTGLASQTKFEDYHGPGRGVGNSINALLDGWILTGENKYMDKAEQLIRRSVSPVQNCDELELGDSENRWSYTVCMTALGRYLNEKLEAGQRDENYDYVRRSLENYGRWMAENEKPALSDPENLEYITEAWAAQDFRKANALRIAACCTDDAEAEAQMRRKADELNEAAWQDLYSFGEQHRTARCLSILMTEGLRDLFHRSCRPDYMPAADTKCDPGEWTMFVPQKARVKQLIRSPFRAVLAATRILNPRRVIDSVCAFRRRT